MQITKQTVTVSCRDRSELRGPETAERVPGVEVVIVEGNKWPGPQGRRYGRPVNPR